MERDPGETRYVKVYKELRAYIIAHDLKPGDTLPPEKTLCEMYGVSRNILREALKGLTLMGVIQGRPGVGNVIQPFSSEELFANAMFSASRGNADVVPQLLDVRKKLELAYMRDAFYTLKDEDVKHIREILERIKADWANGVYYHADDKEFHMALFAKIGNQALHDILTCIWGIDENFKVESKMLYMGKTIAKHENIVRALEERNPEAFEAAMLAHFSSGKYAVNVKDISFEEY